MTGVTAGVKSGSLAGLPSVLGATMVYLPAIWVMTGIAILLFGVLPRVTVAAWVVLVVFLLIAEFGRLLDLPDWLMQLSPFNHVPRLPAVPMTWGPVLVLGVLAALLAGAGIVSFRRRDLICS
jgi:ABC-2 type transport system permease protein